MNSAPGLYAAEYRLPPTCLPFCLKDASPPNVRVAVFGSFYGGFHVLSELLEPPLAELVTVTGVATDDPTQPFVHANVRLWKYAHTEEEGRLHTLHVEGSSSHSA